MERHHQNQSIPNLGSVPARLLDGRSDTSDTGDDVQQAITLFFSTGKEGVYRGVSAVTCVTRHQPTLLLPELLASTPYALLR